MRTERGENRIFIIDRIKGEGLYFSSMCLFPFSSFETDQSYSYCTKDIGSAG